MPQGARPARPRPAATCGGPTWRYQAIGEVTGAELIIDSSKVPSGAALLARQRRVTPYLVHVVRDPRGVAHSWQRPKAQLDLRQPAMMRSHSVVDSTAKWVTWNLLTELTERSHPGHSCRLRYEDFVAAPRRSTEELLEFTGTAVRDGPFHGEQTVTLASNHTVSGNPSRFHTGQVEIRADDAWREELPSSSRRIVSAMALPLLARYGYPSH